MTASIDACKAVEVETVEARLRRRVHVRVVAGPQPLDEFSTSRLRHIHAGKRRKSDSAASASASRDRPMT